MKRILTIVMILFIGISSFAQVDAEAKKILDKLSVKSKAYKTMEVEFTLTVSNKTKGINEVTKGTMKLKGEAYRLLLKDQEIICNGTKIYTYSKEANEVQVIGVDELEKDAITPKNIFTIYENNFKSALKEKKVVNGKNIAVIDLYPTNPKEKDFTSVKLEVDLDKNQFSKATVTAKNGTTYVYKIDKFTADKEYSSSTFTFDKSKYPGVSVIE